MGQNIYSTNIDILQAYKIDQKAIESFAAAISKFLEIENTKVSVSLEEEHDLSFTNASELFGDLLIQSKTIESISISGSNYKTPPPSSASISLRTEFYPVRIRISGDRDRCTILRGELLEILASKRQWYSLLYSKPFQWIGPASIGALLGITLTGVTAGDLIMSFTHTVRALVGIVLLLIGAYWIRRILFPKMQFDFGRSGRAASLVEKWRSFVFIIIIVGLAVGIIASVVATYITR